jgi:DNA-directed RNA polymerase specialized sigma24 family protein
VPFDTTRWSLVVAAGSADSAAARAALSALCDTYWYPLYAYLRHRGVPADDARDLTQAFLTSLMDRQDLKHVSHERGCFRSFLLASLQHFLANDAARQRTAKRGGGMRVLSLDSDEAEGRYRLEPAGTATPETLYERRWALMIIERVLVRLGDEWSAEERGREFEMLKACLLGEGPKGGYAAMASALGTSEGALKVAVHRLRRRFQTELKRDIGETVADPADIDDEIRYLIQGFVPNPPNPTRGTLLVLGTMALGAIWTVVRTTRGPHDFVAGTWVVPR